MPPERQRPAVPGCWTCKVRRKKCDQGVPTCKDCTFLELDCLYSDVKPGWMDNGTKQQRMADRLKAQVKQNTTRRIRRKKARKSSRETDLAEEDADEEHPSPPRAADASDLACTSLPTPSHTAASSVTTPDTFSTLPYSPHPLSNQSNPQSNPTSSSFEPSLLMSYLDYAFPLLFPFYQPSVFEGGRAWLLTLVLQSAEFYHNVLGLAAYFYCAVPVMPGPAEDACAQKAQEELGVHMERAVREVKCSLRSVCDGSLEESVRVLGSVVQLIGFEVAFAMGEEWKGHLHAAVSVLDAMIKRFGRGDEGIPALSVLLGKLRCGVPSNCSVWAPEQAALRFFAAVLVHQDVIASTTRQEGPRLIEHHGDLLVGQTSLSTSSDLLDLQDFTGCPNWVLRSISHTSALAAWKTEAQKSGTLDFFDLMHRAAPIQQCLREGYLLLDSTTAQAPWAQTSPYAPLESLLSRSNISHASSPTHLAARTTIATVWALAAEVYLITVLSGWQPANARLESNVAQALGIMMSIDNPAWLRSLSWPFCVLGCLANRGQEVGFREVVRGAEGLGVFGTLRDAADIVEKVWRRRDEGCGEEWSMERCLGILGHGVLLV